MNSKFLSLALLILLAQHANAQVSKEQRLKEDAFDTFHELDKKELTLRFYNALNAAPVPDAEVEILNIGRFVTDFEGRATFPIPENDGFYTVQFLKKGFVKTEFKIEIAAGTLFFNRFSISPTMPIGYLRVVLDWEAKPRDLDAHFIKNGVYHISYRNMRVSNDGVTSLDRDDIDGYGPETITAKNIDAQAEYIFAVHDYTNRNQSSSSELSRAKACVKVFGDGRLMNIFYVPQSQNGNYWEVFKMVNGEVIPLQNPLISTN